MIQDKKSIGQFYNFRTPYRKPNRYAFQFYLFIVLFATVYVFNIVTFALGSNEIFHMGMYPAFIILGGLSCFLFIVTSMSDPGILKSLNCPNNHKYGK